ncbi:hypothetical protein, partial [Mycobacteroides abscessus]|uniref:hypothetical protein n=1 Tax=Mycobacteroides abscessus TaxID=36809 RepID=UPI0010421B78
MAKAISQTFHITLYDLDLDAWREEFDMAGASDRQVLVSAVIVTRVKGRQAMAGSEKKIAAAGAAVRGESDIAQWGLGDSLTVVVPDELVSEFVGILGKGEPSSLCDVLSANGITINFRPE